MYEEMGSFTEDISRRFSLPSSTSVAASDVGEERRLPPLPQILPLPPRGPFSPFNVKDTLVPNTPGPQETFQFKSPWAATELITTPPSPANSAEGSWQESFAMPKSNSVDWPNDLSQTEIMALVAPQNLNRKAPLQQLCGRKRKGSTQSTEDDQREKHRIAEGNRRSNLSELHRQLDSRIHDFFLERAGWNPSKSLTQSKEHIVQGAIYLIDFMLAIIVHLIRQEQVTPQLSEKLQPQVRCMQLQQLVSSLQQQNLTIQQQIKATKAENEILADRNRALEFQLKSYEQMFRSPKSECTSPGPVLEFPEHKRQKKNGLPGMRVLCDEVATSLPSEAPYAVQYYDSMPSSTHHSFSNSYLTATPPMTGPASPAFPPSQSSSLSFPPPSRRPSLIASP
ncbi:Helix-loop-helix DNA-binding [Penicillium digitatum]|uniref:Helix-loop-helix DNA-binding n=1 Tax=Penicillium digitatum TaxID=36651 RepID=A0A7T7BM41_PENDI|nr:Helix-loop-helix DNA-binding [Penicillium digitatum]